MADAIFEKFMRCEKEYGLFFLIFVLLAASAGEANSDHMVVAFVLYTCKVIIFLKLKLLSCFIQLFCFILVN